MLPIPKPKAPTLPSDSNHESGAEDADHVRKEKKCKTAAVHAPLSYCTRPRKMLSDAEHLDKCSPNNAGLDRSKMVNEVTDNPKYIPDPTSQKPDDWYEDMDGEWEPSMIRNPAYQGPGANVTGLCDVDWLPAIRQGVGQYPGEAYWVTLQGENGEGWVYSEMIELLCKVPARSPYQVFDSLWGAHRYLLEKDASLTADILDARWEAQVWRDTARAKFYELGERMAVICSASRGVDPVKGVASGLVQGEDDSWSVTMPPEQFVNWLETETIPRAKAEDREGDWMVDITFKGIGKKKAGAETGSADKADELADDEEDPTDFVSRVNERYREYQQRKSGQLKQAGQKRKRSTGSTSVAKRSEGQDSVDGPKRVPTRREVSRRDDDNPNAAGLRNRTGHLSPLALGQRDVPAIAFHDLNAMAKKIQADIKSGRCPFFESARMFGDPPKLYLSYVEKGEGMCVKAIEWEDTKLWGVTRGYFPPCANSPHGVIGVRGLDYRRWEGGASGSGGSDRSQAEDQPGCSNRLR